MKERKNSGSGQDSPWSRRHAAGAVIRRVASVAVIIVAACVLNSPAGNEPVLSQMYPYAAATPGELEYFRRLYDVCVSGDMPALEELSLMEESAEEVYNKVMVPFSRQLFDKYAISGTHFYEDGAEYYSIEFDGVNAGYQMEARGKDPVVTLKFSFDSSVRRLRKLSFDCKRNGFNRSIFVTKEYGDYGVRIMSSLYKEDSQPVGTDSATAHRLITRDNMPEHEGRTVTEAVWTGEFDFFNGCRILKTGTAEFSCCLWSGESYSGSARVEDFKTVSVDETLPVTIETTENGVTVHTMWLQCGKLWTAFRMPWPLPSVDFKNAPGYRQFPFVVWAIPPSAEISPYNGQLLELD